MATEVLPGLPQQWPISVEAAYALVSDMIEPCFAPIPVYRDWEKDLTEWPIQKLEGQSKGLMRKVANCKPSGDDQGANLAKLREAVLLKSLGFLVEKDVETIPAIDDSLDSPELELPEELKSDLRNHINDVDWAGQAAQQLNAAQHCVQNLCRRIAALLNERAGTGLRLRKLQTWPKASKRTPDNNNSLQELIGVLICAKVQELIDSEEADDPFFELTNASFDACVAALFAGRPDFPQIRRDCITMAMLMRCSDTDTTGVYALVPSVLQSLLNRIGGIECIRKLELPPSSSFVGGANGPPSVSS